MASSALVWTPASVIASWEVTGLLKTIYYDVPARRSNLETLVENADPHLCANACGFTGVYDYCVACKEY